MVDARGGGTNVDIRGGGAAEKRGLEACALIGARGGETRGGALDVLAGATDEKKASNESSPVESYRLLVIDETARACGAARGDGRDGSGVAPRSGECGVRGRGVGDATRARMERVGDLAMIGAMAGATAETSSSPSSANGSNGSRLLLLFLTDGCETLRAGALEKAPISPPNSSTGGLFGTRPVALVSPKKSSRSAPICDSSCLARAIRLVGASNASRSRGLHSGSSGWFSVLGREGA